MYPYNGRLNQNLITAGLYNQVISQQVFKMSVATPVLADAFRVDGSMFGDTKLYYSADVGHIETWADVNNNLTPDRLAAQRNKINRNKSAVCQSIKMGVYKYATITTDRYLSKQAFATEGAFGEMIGELQSSLLKAKKIYENALINTAVGTHVSTATLANITVNEDTSSNILDRYRLTTGAIMEQLDILKADLRDNTEGYTELGYTRAPGTDDMILVWNVKQKAKINRYALPNIYNEDLLNTTGFKEYELPERFFGNVNTAKTTKAANVKALKHAWYDVSAADAVEVVDISLASDALKAKCIELNPGDVMPATGNFVDASRGVTVNVVSTTFPAGHSYTVDSNVVFKIMNKDALPYMSAFVTGTEDWNPLSLTLNNHLVFGHNELEWIRDSVCVTLKLNPASN